MSALLDLLFSRSALHSEMNCPIRTIFQYFPSQPLYFSLGERLMYRRLRDLREDNDFTQKYVAEKISFTHSAYAKIERGERILSADVIIKLSNLYNVSTDYLLGQTDFPHRIKKNLK